MITRHPLGRQDLRIKRRDKVLEIGPGHDPMFRSDVIADKFPHDDTHRCGKVLITLTSNSSKPTASNSRSKKMLSIM